MNLSTAKPPLVLRYSTKIELVGARANLLENPVFEGRNEVVAEDALENILPFHLKV